MTNPSLVLGNDASPVNFELFNRQFGVNIIGLTLKCPKCGNKWGLSVWDEKILSDIRQDKLICYECEKKESNKQMK